MNRGGLSLLMVGDELLDGRTLDTNSHWLLERAARRAWRVDRVEVVGDTHETIVAALTRTAANSRCVIVTGGLGPTEDDLTREALAAWMGEPLQEDPETLAWIEGLFHQRGREMSPSNRRQAQRPASAEVLRNPVGTAPGLLAEHAGSTVVLLPGVPAELHALFDQAVRDRLAPLLDGGARARRRLRTSQVAESKLADRVLTALGSERPAEMAWCVTRFGVDVILRDDESARLAHAAELLREELGARIFTEEDLTLAEVALASLRQRGWTVAVAESCTGGLLGAEITDVPGSSEVFVGGTIAYANAVKIGGLGVPADLIDAHGAVSEQVARAMAEGARRVHGSDLGVATTGIAGPGGGTEDKPVGTVWIAWCSPRGSFARQLRFGGDRGLIRRWTVAACLDALRIEALEG